MINSILRVIMLSMKVNIITHDLLPQTNNVQFLEFNKYDLPGAYKHCSNYSQYRIDICIVSGYNLHLTILLLHL